MYANAPEQELKEVMAFGPRLKIYQGFETVHNTVILSEQSSSYFVKFDGQLLSLCTGLSVDIQVMGPCHKRITLKKYDPEKIDMPSFPHNHGIRHLRKYCEEYGIDLIEHGRGEI
jgi:hypothetical protein